MYSTITRGLASQSGWGCTWSESWTLTDSKAQAVSTACGGSRWLLAWSLASLKCTLLGPQPRFQGSPRPILNWFYFSNWDFYEWDPTAKLTSIFLSSNCACDFNIGTIKWGCLTRKLSCFPMFIQCLCYSWSAIIGSCFHLDSQREQQGATWEELY